MHMYVKNKKLLNDILLYDIIELIEYRYLHRYSKVLISTRRERSLVDL